MIRKIEKFVTWFLYLPNNTRWGQRANRWLDDRGWN